MTNAIIEKYSQLPKNHYPYDGCFLLVRDCFKQHFNINVFPDYHDRTMPSDAANQLVDSYRVSGIFTQLSVPKHLCMVVACRGNAWHCGVFTTEQMPGYVVHTLGGKIKIEALGQFKKRFDQVEYFELTKAN